jgi:hypothetical protein
MMANLYSDGPSGAVAKNGDQFTVVFDRPVTFAAPSLHSDGSVAMIDYNEYGIERGICNVAADTTTLACNITNLSDTDSNFDFFVSIKTPIYSLGEPLGVTVTGLGGSSSPIYSIIASPYPVPVFDTVLHGTRTATPVKFFIPVAESTSVGGDVLVAPGAVDNYNFALSFRSSDVTTRVFSPSCSMDGKVYANLGFVSRDSGFSYNVTFTEAGLAAMDENNAIECLLTIDLKSTYVKDNRVVIYKSTDLYDIDSTFALPFSNGPISAMPRGPQHLENYLFIESARPFTTLDRGAMITINGIQFTQSISAISCNNEYHLTTSDVPVT